REKDLMDIAGHELRTPASIIKTNLHLLRKRLEEQSQGDIDKKLQTYLDRLIKGTERQIKLVNTFMESARIDNKRFELNIETSDFGQIVTTSVEESRQPAQDKGLNIVYTPMTHKNFIDVDAIRIRQVIDNILTNAIKYTTHGYIEVEVSETKDSVELRVRDTGIGIRDSDIPQLFKKFSRIDEYIGGKNGKVVRPGGTGLGLFVAKNIIDAHNGKILVQSKFGHGSTFTVTIPKKQKTTKLKLRTRSSGSSKMILPPKHQIVR
ncbi:MAG: HAMP domain-containing sensor histidine kinase, partial [Patescibacteria group bacterium]|nr:HAMP domain-containing sensor histidine kinase [Patescibacteria group bacterium]